MDDRWSRIEALFLAAADLPASEREALLTEACGDDAALADEVRGLIAADARDGGRIAKAIGREAEHLAESSALDLRDHRVGAYRIIAELGHGGMGTVYRARRDDDQYRTEVAIKVLHRDLEGTQASARFRDERQILASLRHPNIVRLLDGGTTEDGVPYLVMEHVEGVALGAWVRDQGPSIVARLKLVLEVCDAVQYAHRRLVVHRDLKPANILVGRDGHAKLLDFGIAKLLDDGLPREARTGTGMHVLTPEYASPEQVRGEPVSTSTDVYSLGLVLYEVLTGTSAQRIDSDDELAMLRGILEREPPRPSNVVDAHTRRVLVGDLDTIVAKALQKDSRERYASVAALSDDLRCHLAGLPIQARAASWRYRVGKLVRRNSVAVVAAGAVALSLIGGAVVSLTEAARADAHATLADAQARSAEQRFADLRRLANTLLFEVDDKIRDLAGATTAREVVVTRALEYLDRLARDANDDRALAVELAMAYAKIGDIQGNDQFPHLGRPADALVSYAKARAIVEPLVASGSDDASARVALGLALAGTGVVHYGNGDAAGAHGELAEAVRMMESVPRVDRRGHERLLRTYAALARVEPARGSLESNVALNQRIIAAASAWASATDDDEARYWIGIGEIGIGSAYARAGDPDAAVTALEHARDRLQQLATKTPERAPYVREAAFVMTRIGRLQSGVGDTTIWWPSLAKAGEAATASLDKAGEAATELARAVPLLEELARRDPSDVRAALHLLYEQVDLAVAIAQRDPIVGIAALDRLRPALRTTLGEASQGELIWYADCAAADAYARLGRREDALAHIDAGLAAAEPPDLFTLEARLQRPTCHYLAGQARHTLGDDAAAAVHFEAAADSLRRELAARPSDVTPYIGLTATLDRLGEIKRADRCALVTEARAAWRAWPGAETAYTRREDQRLAAAARDCEGAPHEH